MPTPDEAGRTERVSRRTVVLASLVSVAAAWLFGRAVPETEQHHRHFQQLQRQVATLAESTAARAAERGQVLRLRALARATAEGAQRATLEGRASRLAAGIGWNDRQAVRTALVLGGILSPWRSTPVTLHDAGGKLVGEPSPAAAGADGCQGCHVAIATSGYEAYPQPLRTHPQLAAYAATGSPHPADRVECTQCHEGRAEASTFEGARHARLDVPAAQQAAWQWADPAALDSMVPTEHAEASCTACHAGELYQPPAAKLNEALLTVERGGCYACHEVAAFDRAPKRGPDLRHIRQKLTPEWVRRWLANPRRIKAAAWMPQFWRGGGSTVEEQAAIAAVTEYLFTQNASDVPVEAGPPGNADNGKVLVESLGCLGCHVVGAADRDTLSLRRTFGQALDGLGTKTTRGWLASWVRDPIALSPETRMPRLRLNAAEGTDIAAYLSTLTSELDGDTPMPGSDDPYRTVVRQYAASQALIALADHSSGRELRELAGRVVIDAVGCVNCHEIDGLERPRTPRVPIARRRVWRAADAKRIHQPAGGNGAATAASRGTAWLAPDYGLGEKEAARLALALSAIAGTSVGGTAVTGPDNRLRAAGRSFVQQRNCVGCHAIEGTGGDFVSLVPEPALGPPLLTPEGARVQPDWLRRFLNEPTMIRPWLTVRMPTFGLYASDIDRVGDYLRLIAPENPPAPRATAETVAAGKELFDLLKCQQCHVLDAVPADQPAANLAPDLRLAHDRLQPAWIQAWLQNPTAILPGTRMPSFWPQYPQSYYDPLGRDAAAQIQAIRDHLLTLR